MKTVVNLQEPFSYAFWPIILVGAMIFICVGILIFPKIKSLFKTKKVPVQEKAIEIKRPLDITRVKNKRVQKCTLFYFVCGDQINVYLYGGKRRF